MNNNTPPRNLKNAAWVTIPTRLTVKILFKFCSNVERVYRFNPYLRINSWRNTDTNIVDVDLENYSNEKVVKVVTRIKLVKTENEIHLEYASGIKAKTLLLIEEANNGAQLTIIDDYGDSDQQDVQQVDKSLTAWGKVLEKFFSRYFYLRRIPLADKIIDRFWLRLSPTGRRITYILVVITVIEIVALLLFVLLFWLL